jgi:hypothetical protein
MADMEATAITAATPLRHTALEDTAGVVDITAVPGQATVPVVVAAPTVPVVVPTEEAIAKAED